MKSALRRSPKGSLRKYHRLWLERLEDRCVPSTSWTQRGGDAGHTSYVDVAVDPTTFVQDWSATLGYAQSGTGSWAERAVAIDASRVYRTELEGYAPVGTYHVIAYDLKTGAEVWHRTFVGNAFEGVGEPSVWNGIVYVNRAGHSGISGGTDADLPRIYGLNATTGTTILERRYAAQWGSNERPVIRDNQLVVEDGYYGGVSAYTASTLSRQWFVGNSAAYDPPFAALDDQYVYAFGSRVYNRTNGALLPNITHPLGATISISDPMVSQSGRVLFETSGYINNQSQYGVAAYDGDTHAHLWTTWFTSSPYGIGKAVGNGIVAMTLGRTLSFLNESDGSVIRSWQAPADLTTEIILTRSHAFVQTVSYGMAKVHAISIATGQEVWSYTYNNSSGAAMEMAYGGDKLLLSHHQFVRAFSPANRAPDAVNDSATTAEDTTFSIHVTANDTDPDGDPLTISSIGTPSNGTATISVTAGGRIIYNPNPNFHGTDTFTYTISDGEGGSDTATVTVTITPVNDAPVANNNSYSVRGSLTVTAPGILSNDVDVDGDPLLAQLVDVPANGNISFNGEGSFTYTPFDGWTGTDTFTYRAYDGQVFSNLATVYLAVGNDPPVAVNDSYSVNEDTTLSVAAAGVLINDTDAPGTTLSAILVANPTKGSVTLNANGSFTYIPNANFNGTDSFTYKANDGVLDSNVATVTITVNPINDAPTAVNDSYSVNEDTVLNITAPGIIANDVDIDGNPLTATLLRNPTNGTLAFNADGSFSYAPGANFNGTDTFLYKVNDGTVDSNIGTVTITVLPVNDAPVANNDNYTINEDASPFTVAAPGVLGNDTDIDSSNLSAVLVTGASAGSVFLNANGSFTYYAPLNYNGTVTFTYHASDGSATSNTATVTINILPVPDPPVSSNDSYQINEDTVLNVAAAGVLANDSDPEGNPITAHLYGNGPANGSVTLNADGSFVYTPRANFSGNDKFQYRAFDGSAYGNVATVSIKVLPVNDAPVAINDLYQLGEDQEFIITAPAAVTSLNMVSDPGDWIGQGRTYNLGPGNGTFTATRIGNGGVRIYYQSFTNSSDYWDLEFVAPWDTPLVPGTYNNATRYPFQPEGTVGMDITGQHRGSNTLTGFFTVLEVAYGPGGEVLRFAATFEQHSEGFTPALRGTIRYNSQPAFSGLLSNDQDADFNKLSAVLVSGPTNGALTFNADGSFRYLPNANFSGVDSFTYKANDGTADSNVATVTLIVSAINDPPVANNDSYAMNEDATLNVSAPGVLGNDTDVEGAALSAVLVAGPNNGALTLNSNGSFTYTPNPNFDGADSFTYRANDGSANSNVATVTITVSGVNEAPVANNDSYSVNEDTTLTVSTPGVLLNDTDADGQTLSAVLVAGPTKGTLTLNANGSFTYVPNANYNGPDSFTYKANDGQLDSNVATVSITVSSVNDAPVAVNDNYYMSEDTTLTISAVQGLLSNDGDVDGDALTAAQYQYTPVSTPMHGTLTLNSNGSFTYTPFANYHGLDTFYYRASDGLANSNVGTVTIRISPVNDAPVANNDAYTVPEDGQLGVQAPGVLGNDTDVDGPYQTASLVTTTSNGTLSFSVNGSFLYTPAPNFNGTDSFTYKVSDGSLDSNIATVTFTVTPVNDAPVANNDAYTVSEEGFLDVPAPGVIANDGDVDGNPLTAILVSGTAHGNLTLFNDGRVWYAPAIDYSGTDSFTYKVSDGAAQSNIATVTFTVTNVNDAPVARDESYTIAEDGVLTVAAPGILANDTDADGNTLTATLVIPTANGNVTVNSNGSFVYTPNANFTGSDVFQYVANDGQVNSNVGFVYITVTPVNDAPVANSQTVSVTEDGEVQFTLSASDLETPASGLVFRIASVPSSGALYSGTTKVKAGDTFTGPPTLRYEPGLGHDSLTADAFTFTASDGSLTSGPATVSVNITKAVADGTATIDAAGIVRVGGTAAGDVIVGKYSNSKKTVVLVTINGSTVGNFTASQVKEMRIWGRDGADNINIKDLVFASLIEGGAGNDAITGGFGDDLLWGGTGNDTITGNNGDDFMVGGAGADSVNGGNHNDVLVGGAFARPWTRKETSDFLAAWAAGGNPQDTTPELGVIDTEFDTLTGGKGRNLFFRGNQ